MKETMLNPRENLTLFGHQKERDAFLQAFHSPRFPHAWIVAGSFGIGKATFSFHMARYILSGRQDRQTQFSDTDSLYRRVMAKSHGDLWTCGGEGTSEIGIEPIRELNSFLNQTPAEGGWRVVIIDGADGMNRNAANALLKRLEEPPPKTVFFLTAALPGRLLPTIRSRCHVLPLTPLEDAEVKEALSSQGLASPDFFSIAQGSPGRLMRLMEGEGGQIYTDLQSILSGGAPTSFIHTYGGEEGSYALVEDLLRNLLHTQLLAKLKSQSSLFADRSFDQALKVYDKIEELFDQCRFAQLDRKATLTCVFASL
jgi:DNA polymerase-3 subunit delta'